ncbi:hypothetical protein [Nitrospira sp. M1]
MAEFPLVNARWAPTEQAWQVHRRRRGDQSGRAERKAMMPACISSR